MTATEDNDAGIAAELITAARQSVDPDKLARAGAPTSTFWHFEDYYMPKPAPANNTGYFTITANVGTGKVNRMSQVAVSATEIDSNGTPVGGSAIPRVYTVIPQDGGKVTVRGATFWSTTAIHMRLNFIIVN